MNKKTSFKRKAQLLFTALVIIFSGAILLSSCEEDQAPAANIQLDKHAAIDMTIKTAHYEGFDVLVIDRTLYDESGKASGVKTFYDTMPKLSLVTDTMSTGRTVEDENGDSHDIDTLVRHAKNYQIYISVK